MYNVKENSFEKFKKINKHGVEYWSANDIQSLFGYLNKHDFKNAIDKAIVSCRQGGNNCKHHFTFFDKLIVNNDRAANKIDDYYLSRFACYLIARNENSCKSEALIAQKYFILKTHNFLLKEKLTNYINRLEFRNQIIEESKYFFENDQVEGIGSNMFGIFSIKKNNSFY